MAVLRPSIACFIVAAAVSEAAHLRQGQRHLQTYTQSDDYFSVMLDRVNEARATEGLPPLCTNKKLQNAAQKHSDDQAANNYLDHEGTDGTKIQDRVDQAGYQWNSVAENIAAGQPDVDSVMDTWMNSPGHRDNIMGEYTNFGVAYAYNADSEFKHYWTQDFGTSDEEECDSSASEPKQVVTGSEAENEDSVQTDTLDTESLEIVVDPPLTTTSEETVPEASETEDPFATETLSGTENEEPASDDTDAPVIELPEETPVVVVDPPEIGTPAPEKVYESTESTTSASYYKHKDCDSGL